MGKLIRRVIAVLLTVTALLIAVLPSGTAEATTTHGDYEYDGNTLVKYLGSDSEVTLPNWVTKIGNDAFSGNTSLTRVVMPDSVREIDYQAFEGCTNLQSVVMSESVRTIGSSAFSGCKRLEDISLPARLSSLGSGVFAGCNSLSDVVIDSNNESYVCSDGVIYSKNGNEVVQYLAGRPYTSYAMPNVSSKIGEYSFWGASELSSISLSDGVNRIPEYAFSNCDGLKNIFLPNSVETINAYAFSDCNNLESINIPESVGFIDDRAFYMTKGTKIRLVDNDGNVIKEYNSDDVDLYGNGTDENSPVQKSGNNVSALTQQMSTGGNTIDSNPDENYEFNEGVLADQNSTSKYNGSFSGSDGWVEEIDNVNYSENTQPGEIGSTAIIGGNAVVMFPSSTPVMSGYDIQKAENEDDYALSTGTDSGTSDANQIYENTYVKYNGDGSDVNIPEGIESIGDRAFYKNENVDEVVLPVGVSEIGDFAFARSNIDSVVVPEGMREIGYGAFYNCNKLENINIPGTVDTIKLGALSGSAFINEWKNNDDAGDFLVAGDGILLAYKGKDEVVDIPSKVKHIGPGAFSENRDIKSVNIPGTVISIGEEAFNNCTELSTVKLNEGLNKIEDRAFRNTKLSVVSIPDSVNKIGLGAFDTSGNGNTLNCVIIKGDDVPNVSFNDTATRLSAKSLRSRPFEGVKNIIVEADCDLNSGSILDPTQFGFTGQVYSISGDVKDGLILRRETLEPDNDGVVTVDPVVRIGNDKYNMINVKDSAFDYYKDWNSWTNNRPTGIVINGNNSGELSELLDNITGSIESSDNNNFDGILVNLNGNCFKGQDVGLASITDVTDSFVMNISEDNANKEELSHAFFDTYKTYPGTDSVYIDITLFDKTQTIPIHKVGNNKVEVAIPVPKSMKEKESVKIACLDDNGTLRELTSDVISVDDSDMLLFVTSYFGPYIIYGRVSFNTNNLSEDIEDGISVTVNELETAENPGFFNNRIVNTLHKEVTNGIEIKWFVVAILLSMAGILLLYKSSKYKK